MCYFEAQLKTIRDIKMFNSIVKLFSVLFLALLFCFLYPRSTIAQEKEAAIKVGELTKLHSNILDEDRPLLIYTPSDYEQSKDKYSVLYVLDGDAHFHHTIGSVNFLSGNDRIPKMIIVAIPNTDRIRDLTPPSEFEDDQKEYPNGGGADNFLNFLKDELIPYIDTNYRTRNYKTLVGHSFGGLFVIHTMVNHPNVFNSYIAISPSLWWENQKLVEEANQYFKSNPDLVGDMYMTMANEGTDMLGGALKLTAILEEVAPKNFRWDFKHMDYETHNSIPLKSTYNGLEKIFEGYYIHDPIKFFSLGGLSGLDKNYKQISERLGYTKKIPVDLTINVGNSLLKDKRFEYSIDVFKRTIRDYPSNDAGFNGLGEAYAALNKNELAISHYTKALELNLSNKIAKEKLIKFGVDVTKLIPEIKLDIKLLMTYKGEYKLPSFTFIFDVVQGILTAQTVGKSWKINAINVTTFYVAETGSIITFIKDKKGKINSLTLNQKGKISIGKKIK